MLLSYLILLRYKLLPIPLSYKLPSRSDLKITVSIEIALICIGEGYPRASWSLGSIAALHRTHETTISSRPQMLI